MEGAEVPSEARERRGVEVWEGASYDGLGAVLSGSVHIAAARAFYAIQWWMQAASKSSQI